MTTRPPGGGGRRRSMGSAMRSATMSPKMAASIDLLVFRKGGIKIGIGDGPVSYGRMIGDLNQLVRTAAARPEVRAAVAEVYAKVQMEIDIRRPRCDISGRCCRFETFGHRLYVTTMELAAFIYDLD